MIGGIGPCGKALCCSSWLGDFEPVSIKMAKDQNLSLNPSKISGICGRLFCCLKYEHNLYQQILDKIPGVGSLVDTIDGEGIVVDTNVLLEEIKVKRRNPDNSEVVETYPLYKVTRVKQEVKVQRDDIDEETIKELKKLEE